MLGDLALEKPPLIAGLLWIGIGRRSTAV